MISLICSLVTPFVIAPLTCTRISCGRPSAISIAIVIMLRCARGSWLARPDLAEAVARDHVLEVAR